MKCECYFTAEFDVNFLFFVAVEKGPNKEHFLVKQQVKHGEYVSTIHSGLYQLIADGCHF